MRLWKIPLDWRRINHVLLYKQAIFTYLKDSYINCHEYYLRRERCTILYKHIGRLYLTFQNEIPKFKKTKTYFIRDSFSLRDAYGTKCCMTFNQNYLQHISSSYYELSYGNDDMKQNETCSLIGLPTTRVIWHYGVSMSPRNIWK